MFEKEYLKVLSTPSAIQIGGLTFMDIEVADDPKSLARGLMLRDDVPDDFCMLFKFDDERPRSFWMKNCRFPIVVVFLDKDYNIVSWHRMKVEEGPAFKSYLSGKPAMYAIEFKDSRDEYDIMIGQQIVFQV